MDLPTAAWTVVLPVKGGPGAKSRLRVGGAALARAIAEDTLDAVLGCPVVNRVIVVTADGSTAAGAERSGALVVAESRPGQGLDAAIRDGLAAADRDGRPGPVAVLLGDLPALRSEDLDAGLRHVAKVLDGPPPAAAAVVPDAAGTGTVLLAGRRCTDLDPAFGPGSLAEHVRRGAVPVELDAPRLRQDVDTPADLQVALALGVGRRTAAAVACARRAG